jgi:starch synthase
MDIGIVSAEMVPFAKVGGLADVIGALSKELVRAGNSVSVFLPRYRGINGKRYPGLKIEKAGELDIRLGSKVERAQIGTATVPGTKVRLILVGNDHYFDRENPYVDPATNKDWPDNAERFVFFNKAVLESLRLLQWTPDVLHLNDYQAGVIPALLRERYKDDPNYQRIGIVYSIHNMGYQGIFPAETLDLLGLDKSLAYATGPLEYYGKVNFMKAAILYSDLISTVSERYAQEIQTTEEFGFGLEGVLRTRTKDLAGILNGIDTDIWDPAKDKLIPINFSPSDLQGKKEDKIRLLESMELPVEPEVPLIGIISRLVDQKGFDLFEVIAPELFAAKLKMIVLGSGQPKYEALMRTLRQKYPTKFAVALEFNDPLAHLIEAGSDFFLMPSRYEPCGLNQMYSLRYGTVPIVRATGGLADTVQDYDAETGKGNGFVFEEYSGEALLGTIRRGLALYQKKRPWKKLVTEIMQIDHSWGSVAKKYVQAYERAQATRLVSVA